MSSHVWFGSCLKAQTFMAHERKLNLPNGGPGLQTRRVGSHLAFSNAIGAQLGSGSLAFFSALLSQKHTPAALPGRSPLLRIGQGRGVRRVSVRSCAEPSSTSQSLEKDKMSQTVMVQPLPQRNIPMIFNTSHDKEIIEMAIPSYTSMLLDPIAGIIDTSFVGRSVNGALSLAGQNFEIRNALKISRRGCFYETFCHQSSFPRNSQSQHDSAMEVLACCSHYLFHHCTIKVVGQTLAAHAVSPNISDLLTLRVQVDVLCTDRCAALKSDRRLIFYPHRCEAFNLSPPIDVQYFTFCSK